MIDMLEFIYFNQNIISYKELSFHPGDRGLLFGDGLFETIRIYPDHIPFLATHWQRLVKGTHLLEIPLNLSLAELHAALLTLCEKNRLHQQHALVRLTVTRGHGPRELWPSINLEPSVIITLWPYQASIRKTIRVCVSSIHRNELSPLSQIKSLNYLDNILARREALQRGFDEAILLNTKNQVAEAATANIFIVKNNSLYTPPLTDGALAGVTRQCIMDLSHQLKLSIQEKTITTTDLHNADEAFLTNAALGMCPIEAMEETLFNPPSFTVFPLLHQHYQAKVLARPHPSDHTF